jgi:predicted acyltransferase
VHAAGRADRRLLPLARAAGVIAALLSLYSALMLWAPVPGIGAGVLEPGKDFGAYIDRMLLDGHMWVQSKTWDPEGLFSTMPALCSQLLGVLAGRWLLSGHFEPHRADRVDAAGRPAAACGWA